MTREYLYNHLHTIFTGASGALPEYEWADLLLQFSSEIEGGENARTLIISSSHLTFAYDQAGASPSPSSATITATALDTELTPYYDFLVEGISQQNSISDSYIYTPPISYTLLPQIITVKLREGSSEGTVLAQAQIAIQGTKALSGAITISLSNNACVLPTTTPGGVVTYTGSGTEIRVWEGNVQLSVDNESAPYNAQSFRIGTPVTTNIDCGTITQTYNADHVLVGDMSNMTETTASVEYPIIVTNSAGQETTYYRLQVFSKAIQGQEGSQGLPGEDGITPVVATVSNEICALPADMSGNVSSHVGSGTLIQVFEGTTQLKFTTGTPVAGEFSCGTPTLTPDPSITVGARSASGLNCLVGDHSGFLAGVDSVVIGYPLTVVHSNGESFPLTVTQNITKSKQGYTSQYVSVSGEQVFKYSSTESPIPSPTSIILTANLYGGLTTYQWQYYNVGTSLWANLSGTSNTQTYTLTYNQSEWSTATLRIRCVSGDYNDEKTIVKLYDGTDNISLVFSNESFSFPASVSGVIESSGYVGSGTDIHVYQGITELVYDGVGTLEGTWKINSTTPTNITVGTPFVDQENYVTVPDHSGVSSSIDNASIEYIITGKDSNGSTFNFSKKQVFTKSKAGADGIDGADGADGADGVNARSVKMTSSAGLVFAYNTEGASPTPSNTTITAKTVNTIGDVYYQFFKNDIFQGNPSLSNEYVYSPNASLSSMPEKIEVQIREGSAINPILARDQISIMGVRQGQHAITITSTNESHTIPTDSAGTPGSGIYTGSGTKIEVWEGATKLPADNVSLYANSTFRVAVGTATGITANASPVHNAYDFTIGDHSNMTANIATISYTITVKNSAGIETTYTSLQTFSKSKAGVDSIRYWLESTTASIKKDSGGIFTPTSVTAFAKYQIGEGNATDYAGYWNTYISTDGINEGSPTPVSLNNSASITPSASAKWVRFKLYTDSLRTNLVDQYTVPVVEDGINSITVSLSNEIVSLPSDYSGNVTSYVGSGTTISVFEGSTQLRFTTGTPVAGEFSCGTPTINPSPSITVGARSVSGANCLVAVHSAMSLTVDTAVITYPLSIMRANGETSTFYATQTITKSKPGSSGTWPSEDGLLGYWSFDSINSIPDGPNPIYKKDIFTDTSDFFVYGSNAKIEYIDGHLRFTKAGGANSGFALNRTLTVGTNIRLRARYVLGSGTPSGYSLQMVNSTFSYFTGTLSLPSDGRWVTVNATVISDTSNVYWYLGTYSATDSYSIEFDFLYLGDGSYLSEIEDDSGNKNKALIIGATPLPGIAKNGIALDGNDDYVQLLPTFNRNYDLNMSVSLWFKIPSTWTWDTAGSHTIFGSSNYGTSGGGIYLNTHTTVNYIFPSIRATTPSFMITATSTSISRDTWYHIVINYSSKVLSYYVNGVLKGSVTNTYSGTFDQPYYLGKGTANGTPTSQYLACYVDEVRMYMKALTTEEILALYTLKTVSAENKLQESEEEQLLIPTLQLSANSVINKFPDNPAGIIYRSPIGWPVDEDNWEGMDGETVEVVDGELSISKTVASTHRYIRRVSTNPNSKQVILKIKYDSRLYSIAMYNGSAYVVLCLATQMVHEGEYYIASFYNNLPSITNTYFDITLSSSVTDAIVISDIYIGTGANLNRALNEATDNTHLINNGVLPVIEEGKDYLHFNGKTSRLYFGGPLIGAKGTILFDRKRISESIGTNDYIIDDYVPGTSGARVFFDNTGNKLTLAYQNGSGTTQYVFITDSGRTDVINSHLDGFAWGGGFIYAIEDGVLKKGVSGTIVPSTSVFNIGQCGGAYSPGKLYGFLFFNDIILTQKQINTIKYNGLPSPRYIKNTFLLEKAAEDGSMSPQDKAQELTNWLEYYNEDQVTSDLPTDIGSITVSGEYKSVALLANTAEIWTPTTGGTEAYLAYQALKAYRQVLYVYSTAGTGFLLLTNRDTTTDISALSPSLNTIRSNVVSTFTNLQAQANKILAQKITIKGTTVFNYGFGTTIPKNTYIQLVATPKGITITTGIWQRFTTYWTDLSESATVVGTTTSTLTLYHNASELSTVQNLRVRYLPNSTESLATEVTINKIYDIARGDNLLDPSTWIIGSTGTQPGFTAQSPIEGNSIIESNDPTGALSTIWRCTNTSTVSTSEGGWHTTRFSIDPYKKYRFRVFARRSSMDGSTYFGASQDSTIYSLSGTVNNNPYFMAGGDFPILNRWYLIVGYIHPWNTTQTTNSATTGVYDCVTGLKTSLLGYDYKWKDSSVTSAYQRAYYYYAVEMSPPSTADFWGPAVEVSDGTEPSIDSLLSTYKRKTKVGNYLGRYTAHPSTYDYLDRWTIYGASGATPTRGVYFAGVSSVTRITASSPANVRCYLAEALTDIAWAEEQGTYGTSADYEVGTLFQSLAAVNLYCTTLAANEAFINEFRSNYANIGTVTAGIIQSSDWSTTTGMEIHLTNGTIKIGGSTAPKFSVGTDGVLTVTGGTIQTTATANRGIKITSDSIRGFDASGAEKFYLGASSGSFVSTGGIIQTTANTSRGIKLTASAMSGYDNVGNLKFSLSASTGILTLDGGVLTGGSLTGSLIQTTSTASRGIKMTSSYLKGWDSSGNENFSLDASTGAVFIKGSLRLSSLNNSLYSYDGQIGIGSASAYTGLTYMSGIRFSNFDQSLYESSTYTNPPGEYGDCTFLVTEPYPETYNKTHVLGMIGVSKIFVNSNLSFPYNCPVYSNDVRIDTIDPDIKESYKAYRHEWLAPACWDNYDYAVEMFQESSVESGNSYAKYELRVGLNGSFEIYYTGASSKYVKFYKGDLGTSDYRWRDAYFSRNISTTGGAISATGDISTSGGAISAAGNISTSGGKITSATSIEATTFVKATTYVRGATAVFYGAVSVGSLTVSGVSVDGKAYYG